MLVGAGWQFRFNILKGSGVTGFATTSRRNAGVIVRSLRVRVEVSDGFCNMCIFFAILSLLFSR